MGRQKNKNIKFYRGIAYIDYSDAINTTIKSNTPDGGEIINIDKLIFIISHYMKDKIEYLNELLVLGNTKNIIEFFNLVKIHIWKNILITPSMNLEAISSIWCTNSKFLISNQTILNKLTTIERQLLFKRLLFINPNYIAIIPRMYIRHTLINYAIANNLNYYIQKIITKSTNKNNKNNKNNTITPKQDTIVNYIWTFPRDYQYFSKEIRDIIYTLYMIQNINYWLPFELNKIIIDILIYHSNLTIL